MEEVGDQSTAFLAPMRWPVAEASDPPRALRSLAKIVDGGLCHRCGSCVGICPTGVLALDANEYPRIKNLSSCTDCDLCVKVCPGDEFNFREAYQELYQKDPDFEYTHGPFLKATVAHSLNPVLREHSTSGGLVTEILTHLLETKQIDGAIVIGSASDVLWKGKVFIARTPQDLLSAMKSKYAIAPTNSALEEVRRVPGRYAAVGLPCQIHGLIKARKLDAHLKERIVFTIGLFCHAAIEHEAFKVIWETLGEKGKQAVKFTSRIGKHPGAPEIQLADGSSYPVYFGSKKGYRPTSIEVINILYRLYTPERCLTCFDGLAEFADISVGDPWLAPPEDHVNFHQGWSFGLIRSQNGLKVSDQLVEARRIKDVVLTEKEALACNRMMATEKRWRAFRVIETHRRQGKPIPKYAEPGFEFPQHKGLQFVETEAHMLTHIFCYLPKFRAVALRFMLGSGGYSLFWLNSLRRRFREWRRDTRARLMRNFVGRR